MSRLDKLNLSKDELGRFQKAMDDPAFRALLKEYADEISNPANRAEQEAYLREVEARAKEEEKQKQKEKAGATKPTTTANAGAGAARKAADSKGAAAEPQSKAEAKADPRATPSYQLVHRGFYDMSAGQMSLANESAPTGALADLMAQRPQELVLKISLPLLERVADVNLDQSAQHVLLSSQHYYLSLALPYPVEADGGRAAWSGKTKTLTVSMRVAAASEAELAAYLSQRQGYDTLVAQRESARKEEERKEEQQAQMERIAKQKEDEEERRRDSAPALSSAPTAASFPSPTAVAAVVAAAAAAAAAAAPPAVMPPSSLKSTSPTNSSSSSSSRGSSPKSVRFTLDESDGFIIPERDGPHGPKPVGLLSDHAASAAEAPKPQGKGHRKKHVPGSDGPASWKGIGAEPSKSIRAAFPPEAVGPASPPSLPTSPRVGPNSGSSPRVGPSSSPRNGPATAPAASQQQQHQRLWPAYTYNQSAVSVVVIIKIKSIAADSIKLLLSDGPGPIGADGTAGAPTTRVDLYFSTTAPRRHYRLFLPLSHAINIAKSNHTCTPANLIINLVKLQLPAAAAADGAADAVAVAAASKNEWQQLLDYSVLGDFDAEGTPMSSPATAPVQGGAAAAAAAGGGLEELTLGTTAHAHQAQLAQAQAALVQEVEGLTLDASTGASAPAAPAPVVALQPLPALAAAASTMLNPLVSAAASAATTAAAPPAFTAPSNSLLFQLD